MASRLIKVRRARPIDFGKSRRSYVLDRGRVIDHKSGKETGHVRRVLDGELDLVR